MSSNEQTKSRNRTMTIVFAVVIAVAAGIAIKYQVPGDDAAGTVVPAERYRGEQISSDDVKLDDEEIAQVMQTDVYQLIITDVAFAEAMRSEAFSSLLLNDAFLSAMRSDTF
ncbi:MAG: hypothetical protein GWP02_06540, partial [Desulfobulbaceae bacterium]|nr:hypothetical protein [Desulfobulbaceae bacterium]